MTATPTFLLKEGNPGDALAKIEEKVWRLETENNLLPEKPLDHLELTFRAMEMENQENLLNNSEQNLMFSSDFSEITVDIEAQLRQIRSELEKLE